VAKKREKSKYGAIFPHSEWVDMCKKKHLEFNAGSKNANLTKCTRTKFLPTNCFRKKFEVAKLSCFYYNLFEAFCHQVSLHFCNQCKITAFFKTHIDPFEEKKIGPYFMTFF
jgi:hypothetical protein